MVAYCYSGRILKLVINSLSQKKTIYLAVFWWDAMAEISGFARSRESREGRGCTIKLKGHRKAISKQFMCLVTV
jgi:hypothetical protein